MSNKNYFKELNNAYYQKGINDGIKLGMKIGYEQGFKQGAVEGVEATLNHLGKEASKALRNSNGHPMAFYRKFKSECNVPPQQDENL
ncbi:hypothetical protein [Priestia megaterium]|uniref:hypothetical protein n=1 Tax=Priestia megaterium TaxID=1404 RepID=UPI001C23CB87|nr:hypothetical protein [Priestia megaterium]MBU8754132.1 hypothetical protein [Priestia megaterium]